MLHLILISKLIIIKQTRRICYTIPIILILVNVYFHLVQKSPIMISAATTINIFLRDVGKNE